MHWPAGLKGKENTLIYGVGHVMDVLPTCLELTGVDYPEYFNGKKTTLLDGNSLIPLINQEISTTHDTLFWEHDGGRAIRIGDWKMASLPGEEWELFDLSVDRTEMNNLAKKSPGRVESMNACWEAWALKMKLIE
jgi:arylsulfatase